MFRNIKVFWKFAIVGILIPFAVLVTAGIALLNSSSLKYEYDNLYGFMLVPIMKLDQGNVARAELTGQVYLMAHSDPASPDFSAAAAKASQADQVMTAVIAEYEKSYVTTTSPEFTQTLIRLGKQDLQTQEVNLLKQYHSVYDAYAPQRDALISGKSQDYAPIESNLAKLDDIFTGLVVVT